jgi:ribonuclease HII
MNGRIAGVDEAGRGPLAGPVVAAAVIFHDTPVIGVADSKKLSAKKRDALYDLICANSHYGIGVASVEEIDALNILQATFLAMRRAVAALPVTPARVLVDGNQRPAFEGIGAECVEAIVSGDALVAEISAASILAKVTRDRMMLQLDTQFPGYGFAKHAGYGVPAHMSALSTLGPTSVHRRTFAPVARLLAKP